MLRWLLAFVPSPSRSSTWRPTVNSEGVRLIDEPVINTVIVLMVVTSVLGPVLTDRFGQQLAKANR